MTLASLISVFAVLAFATAMSVVPVRVGLQNAVPEDKTGSGTAPSEAAKTMALLSAPFFGAILVEAFPEGAPFVVGGIVMFAVAALASHANLN